MTEDNCLTRANELINGPRRDSYGPVERSFVEIAAIWSIILKMPVTPKQVGLCMVGVKQVRESNSHKIDNLDDAAGYIALAEKVKDLPSPMAQHYK